MNNEDNQEKKSKSRIIIILLLLLLIGVIVWFMNRGDTTTDELGSGLSGYVVEEGFEPGLSQEEIEKRLQAVVDESTISFNIQSLPTAKGKTLEILFSNPINSAHDLVLEIQLDGEIIVRTDKISPDHYIKSVDLVEALEPGTYTALAKIIGYDRETNEIISQVNAEITITAL